MTRGRMLAIAGLCLATTLLGCPRSKVPSTADPKVAQGSDQFPPPPPWKVPPHQEQRLAMAGLPSVANAHQQPFHIHSGLRIFYNGEPVPVPAKIGLDRYDDPVSPVHTHRGTGVVHVEFGEPREFTLGQFFTLWGVPLGKATVLVDGAIAPDPAQVVFVDQRQIVVLFGPPPDGQIAWPEPEAPDETPSESPTPSPAPTMEPSPEPTLEPSPEATASAAP